MAGEDIILTTLINAGLKINQKDYATAQRKLAALGEEVGVGNLKAQAKQLAVLAKRVQKDRQLLEQAATKGLDPASLSTREKQRLTTAFNRVATYQDQLNKLTNSLNNMGTNIGRPLFNQLSGMKSVLAELGAITGKVAPLIDNITQSYKENLKAARKAERSREARRIRSETLARSREIEAQKNPEGRKLFFSGAQGGFNTITSSGDAKKALKFATAELGARREIERLTKEQFKPNSPEVLRASRELDATAQAYATLTDRVQELGAAEAAQRKADRKAEQEAAKAERKREAQAIRSQTLARAREIEAQKNPEGRKLFFSGAGTDFGSLTKSAEAKQALNFAKAELKARQQVEALLRDRFGADSTEAARAARDADQAAQAYARLTNRVKELAEVEALGKKNQAKADALTRSEANIAEKRGVLARRERAGRRALANLGGIDAPLSNLQDLGTARKIQRFVSGELQQLTARQTALATAFGSSSKQALLASAETNRYANALANLEERIGTLQVATKEQTKAEAAQQRIRESNEKRRIAGIAGQRGRRVFEKAAGDFSAVDDKGDLRHAMQFAKAELAQLQAQQRETGRVFRTNSDEYRAATAEVERYAQAIAALQARLDSLSQSSGSPKVARLKPASRFESAMHDDGRRIYKEASRTEGGLQGLGVDEAQSAKRYVQARLNELRGRAKELSKFHNEDSRQMQQLATGARNYAQALEVLNVAARPAKQGVDLLQGSLRSFIKYALVYQTIYSLAAAFAALGRSVIDLQTELLEIQAVTAATDSQMTRLTSTVISVAKTSKFSLIELTKAAKVLAQAGVSVEDMNSTLRATANFAAATGSNLEIAADLISTTRSVFKELSDDLISNQLAKAINISKLTGEDLKTILSLGAQTAKSFNLTSEQFLGAVATLRNVGLKASTVATGLRQGMLEIFTPDAQLVKALQSRYRALGEDMGEAAVKARFFSFTRSRAPLVAALTELKRLGFNNEGQAVLSRAFDIRSSNAIKAMVANLEELAQNESKITFGRAAAEGARITVDGLDASFTRLKSTISSFTYNRSKGILGFFTEIVQGIDKALQGLDEYDRRQRAKGQMESPGYWDLALGGIPLLYKSIKSAVSGFGPPSAEKLTSMADAREEGTADDLIARDEFEKAALVWDVAKARAGEASGTAAEQLVLASEQLMELQTIVADVFGPEMAQNNEAVRELIRSYTNLAPTQRKARLEALRGQYPQLKELTDQQIEDTFFTIDRLGVTVDGTLQAMREQLLDKIAKANTVINLLKKEQRGPESQEEVEAVALQAIYQQDAAIQEIVLGTSTLTADFQLGLLQQMSQGYADSLRDKGGALPLAQIAKDQAETLILKTQAIAKTTAAATAIPEVRQQANALMANFKDTNEATIGYLNAIMAQLFDAAHAARSATEKMLLLDAVGQIQKFADSKNVSILKETAERVKYAQERVEQALKDPNFRKFVYSDPVDTPGRTITKTAIDTGQLNLADFRSNNTTAKALTKYVTDYDDVVSQQMKVQDEVDDTTGKLLKLEAAARRANEALGEARVGKEFGRSRAALAQATAAEAALIQYEIDDARKNRTRGATPEDVAKNKELTERELRATARLDELYERAAKDAARINREQLKYDLVSRDNAAKRNKEEAAGILRSADGGTPQAVIDAAIDKYNASQVELAAVLEARRKMDGDENDLTEAQLEAEKQKLRSFQEQADFIELAHRREQTVREALQEQLDRQLSSGNRYKDARFRELGLEPGPRAQRAGYYLGRAGTLSTMLDNAEKANYQDALTYAANQKLIDDGKATSELIEKQKKLSDAMRSRRQEIIALGDELGDVELKLVNMSQTMQGALDAAFNVETLKAGLEQAGSSVENLAVNIHTQLIAGIEGVGDAFADALLEGEGFFDSLNDLFIDTGKGIFRSVIKTATTESIGALFNGLPVIGPTVAKVTGTTPPGEDGGQPQSLLGGLFSSLFGKKKAPVGASSTNGESANACCVPDDDPAKDGTGLPEVAATEGKGFFGTLTGWFGGLIEEIGKGFGGVLGNVGRLLGLGGSGGGDSGAGLLGAVSGIIGAFSYTKTPYKGAYGFAGGGVIRGPGTGTSDSIPALVAGPGGRRKPILLSNGESILTAKATAALGEDFIHAANRGQLLAARNGAVLADQAALSRAARSAAVQTIQATRLPNEPRTMQVNVSPAQMRMRLRDWLDQHVLEELARR